VLYFENSVGTSASACEGFDLYFHFHLDYSGGNVLFKNPCVLFRKWWLWLDLL